MNPNAIHLLDENLDKVSWFMLSGNPNAIHLLQENIDKIKDVIKWYDLFGNPSIFKESINYTYLKDRMDLIREELIMKCMHPKRLITWLEAGGDIDDF
jgi:hypothetical protein